MTELLVVGLGFSRVVVAAVARHARLTTSSAARDWTALSHLSRRRTDRLLMAGGVASTALLAGYAKRYGCRPPRGRPAVGRPGALGNRHREIGPQLVFFAAGVARHPDRCAIAHRIPADLPFQQRFDRLDALMRAVYVATVTCSIAATIALVSPVAMHRLLFRPRRLNQLVSGHTG